MAEFLSITIGNMSINILKAIKRRVYGVPESLGFRIERLRSRAAELEADSRYAYQSRFVNFELKEGDRVLDVGSGGRPFPQGTVMVERFVDTDTLRRESFVRGDKPLVVADIHHLPFGDKSFDYVYCSHVVQLIKDPLQACAEIMRVGNRGYIETPTFGMDALFAWAENMQIWHVVGIGATLCFFEYSPRQLKGIQSSVWRETIFSRWHHPLQEIFYNNRDIFTVMFPWSNCFSVFVFRLDGTIQSLNAEPGKCAPANQGVTGKSGNPFLSK